MALGYIAAFSETLALAVIAEKGLAPLCAAVAQGAEDHVRAAAAWSLGQVGRHTPDHAKAVADTGDAVLGCSLPGLWRCILLVALPSGCRTQHDTHVSLHGGLHRRAADLRQP